jgi:hypothetical protein
MAFKDQPENNQPGGASNKITSADFLPRFFRTNANKKFLQATLDQLIQPGEAEKIQGYFGRKNSKAFTPSDNYIGDVSASRESYQLEPALVSKDEFDNVTFYKDYNDYIGQLKVFGADTRNHSRLNSQDSYSWNPNIDWDKFVNFREYYWLPNGPQTVNVRGQAKEIVSTYSVELVDEDDNQAYIFNDGLTRNPTLKLFRGQTYRFDVDVEGHPIAFAISRTFSPGSAILVAGNEGIRSSGLYDGTLYDEQDANYDLGDFIVLPSGGSVSFEEDENVSTIYPDGIRKFGEEGEEVATVYLEKGTIEFTIPENAPDRLYYISKNNIDTSGYIRIENIEENTFLDVENEILGKKTYTSANGIAFTNGLKVKFQGDVSPEIYENNEWYVEGVGDKIKLVKDEDLIIPAAYSDDLFVPFDSDAFDTLPFSNAKSYTANKDYIVINRASLDRNAWTRYNKWFHRDVIEKSATYNGTVNNVNESFRAKRPIIEFEAGLKLANYGSAAKKDVDLVDTVTTDVFSTIEGKIGYKIDGIDLADNMRVLFLADTDNLVKGKIYTVTFIDIGNNRQINLLEAEDAEPQELETVLVTQGRNNAGKSYYFDGSSWKLGQNKETNNQAPLFDVFGIDQVSFSNTTTYNATTFKGTKLFSYKEGTGTSDVELGFPLSYRNINNSGDILFEFNLLTDSFSYEEGTDYFTKNINPGFLKKYKSLTDFNWVNGLSSTPTKSVQKVLRQYIVDETEQQSFEIDMYENAAALTDLYINVFVNNKITNDYVLERSNKKVFVVFNDELNVDDVVLIKSRTSAIKNENGWYDFPINLERNPKNEDFTEFTLGEVLDHVDTMIEDLRNFSGSYPGVSNLRDLGDLDRFGKRFVKHSGPVNLSAYHVTNKNYNLIKALNYSRREYARFKRNFLEKASGLGIDTATKQHVDAVLRDLNKDKVNTEPFYFSDALGYQSPNLIEYEILDKRIRSYALTEEFNLETLTNKSVNVYVNGEQLIYGVDYDFSNPGFVDVFAEFIEEGDKLEIYEYSTTDGTFIPPTPTKLGLYPAYAPEITYDDTYQPEAGEFPEDNIPYKIYAQSEQGYRGEYQVGWFYPLFTTLEAAKAEDLRNGGSGSGHKHMFKGSNIILYMPDTGAVHAGIDSPSYDAYPIGQPMVRGHDGSYVRCYYDYRDNLLLELEKRLFNNIKVTYNKDILNVQEFLGGEFRTSEFTKEEINATLLKDFADWLSVLDNDYTDNYFYLRQNEFTFNYGSMRSYNQKSIPGFWRGMYQQMFDTDRPHTHPWEMLGFTIKPSWWNDVYGPAPYTGDNLILWEDLEEGRIKTPGNIRVNSTYARPGLTQHIPVDSKGNLKSPLRANLLDNFVLRPTSDNFAFGDWAPVENAWRRSSEYPFAILTAMVLNKPAKTIGLGFDISRIQKNFANQFIYNENSKVIKLDDIVFPNTSRSSNRIMTAGLINYISNLISSNVLKVYTDYQDQVKSLTNQLGAKIAGFTDKNKVNVILDSRSIVEDQSQDGVFVPAENFDVFLNTSSPTDLVTYSAVIVEKLATGFLVRGYSKDNPYFDYYSPSASSKKTPITVGGVSEVTTDWESGKPYAKGQVVENVGKFYRVTNDFTSGSTFDTENLAVLPNLPIVGGKTAEFYKNFAKQKVNRIPYGHRFSTSQEVVTFILGYAERLKDLGFAFEYTEDGRQIDNWTDSAKEFLFWTTQGWAAGTIIAISPAANKLYFDRDYHVVDDLSDSFYSYSIFDENGQPLDLRFNSILRDQNSFGIEIVNTDHGLYHVALPIVQKEHVILFDNKTVFNDIIYQPSTGYRQERLKINAYRTDNWQGGFNVPGFVFDDARYTTWTEYKDYKIGDLVKHREYYYVATTNIVGSNVFNDAVWYRLNKQPEKKLLTNFDYRINQFMDFYDLDSIGFDEAQQELAQHLVGYQKRQYLANIINDDISQFKFYNGFIQDKGTMNAVVKLFDSLSDNEEDKVQIFEEWAVQLGRYGSIDNEKQIEYRLTDDKLEESPQLFELSNTVPNFIDKTYRIYPNEVYDKPEGYVHESAFPVKAIKEYLKTGGYVNSDHVTFISYDRSELLDANVNLIELGSYIWLIETGKDDWTVYQIVDTDINATDLLVETGEFFRGNYLSELTIDKWAKNNISSGEYFGLIGASKYNVEGIFPVIRTELNKIKFITGSPDLQNFNDEKYSLVKLREVRVGTISEINDIIKDKQYDDQRFWVDSTQDGVWTVLENNPVYSQRQVINNPSEDDGTNHRYSDSIAVTASNRTMVVASPGDGNGKINIYQRSRENSNFVIDQQILFADTSLFNVENSEFGKSVDISPDGEYIVVGVPKASGVKTRLSTINKGQFSPTTTYSKGDIIKFRESLWQALRTINPETGSQSFDSFNNYQNLVSAEDTDSTNSILLVTGNPGLENTFVDHILVRAPIDMYLGSKGRDFTETRESGVYAGDTVNLYWNKRSYANPTLDNYLPFDGNITNITADWISRSHEIIYKIDFILQVPTFIALPQIGDFVTTTTGRAEVVYVDTAGDSAVIYVSNTNGTFDITGELFVEDTDFIGLYSLEETFTTSSAVGGYWLLKTYNTASAPSPDWTSAVSGGVGFVYNNGTSFYDVGRGLVYADIRLAESSRSLNAYYNIQDTVSAIGTYVLNKNRTSFITQLSYRGDPTPTEADGQDGIERACKSNLWAVRVGKSFSDTLTIGDTYKFQLYDLENRPIDYNEVFLSDAIVNDEQTIFDIWDGYIDFEFTRFDASGFAFQPQAKYYHDVSGDLQVRDQGDVIVDIQTPSDGAGGLAVSALDPSSAGEVVYIQRDFNRVRVYIKILNEYDGETYGGRFDQRNNIGRYELRRLANTDIRGAGDVNRTIGQITDPNNSIVLGTAQVGKLLIYQSDINFTNSLLSWPDTPTLEDEEYYFYNETTNAGISKAANPPYSLNKDYRQLFNLPADQFGTAGPDNAGAIIIYRRKQDNKYELQKVITSLNSQAGREFGSKVRIVQSDKYYTLLVGTKGIDSPGETEATGRRLHPGEIEIFRNGIKDLTNFAGEYQIRDYVAGEIVYYKDEFYESIRPVSSLTAPTDPVYWSNISWRYGKDINYRGAWDNTYSYAEDAIVLREKTKVLLSGVVGSLVAGDTITFTSIDDSSIISKVIESVEGNAVLFDGDVTADFDAFDFTPKSITTINASATSISSASVVERLYKAQTNISEGQPFDNSWAVLDSKIDYLGYLPNLTGDALYNEDVFDPGNIVDFSETFDISADRQVIIVKANLVATDSTTRKRLAVYREADNKYELSQIIAAPTTMTRTASSTEAAWYIDISDVLLSNTTEADDIIVKKNNVVYLDWAKEQKYIRVNNVVKNDVIEITVYNETTEWADNISLNPAGDKFAISARLSDEVGIDKGTVYIYALEDGQFVLSQILTSPQNEVAEQFGYALHFGEENLLISSLNGDQIIPTTFDNQNTTFDRKFTSFRNVKLDRGVVYIYENIANELVFAEKIIYPQVQNTFGENLYNVKNHIYVGIPRQIDDTSRGQVVDFRKNVGDTAWLPLDQQILPVDLDKISGITLYNKRTNEFISRLDYIDPLQGKIAGPAEQEINYKAGFDPAVYNTGLTNDFLVDPARYWGKEHVGEVWWSTNTARFTYAYKGTAANQKRDWNKLIRGSNIDVFEWVESDYVPGVWDELADTDDGLKVGISGRSLYGNTRYSTQLMYDKDSQNFRAKYYFWVQNKRTIPTDYNPKRKLNTIDIANIIEDPKLQGYKFATLINKNQFILYNCNSLISSDDVVLQIRYKEDLDNNINRHNEYQILSEGLDSSIIHPDIERKWYDSLIGFDTNLRPVPDTNIPSNKRYGIQNRPRQSMFKNRFEALKQTIERANLVLEKELLIDSYNLSNLISKEPAPLIESGQFDQSVESYSDLRFVSTNKVVQATIDLIISNGRIISANIINPGRGYKVAPSFDIEGPGSGAIIEFTINNLGQITGVDIQNSGSGYLEDTRIVIRPFSVLVNTNETLFGKWTVYSWNGTSWYVRSIQDYDVTNYWEYIDWYEDGYNQFTTINYSVKGTYLLPALQDRTGDVVKVDSTGSGGWILLEKISNIPSEDYTENYKVIGREKGTIRFKETLYNYSTNAVGFDNRSFDSYFYDNNPVTELRIILQSLRDNILIGELKAEYNSLFFVGVRYALAEQKGLDWIFKTSFVKAKYQVSELRNDITFNSDNLQSFEDYLNEVKPYKTKIREYINVYDKVEPTNTSVTDFDLPPYYSVVDGEIIPNRAVFLENQIVNSTDEFETYPRKNYIENVGFELVDIKIKDSGSGYTFTPLVNIIGDAERPAQARAYIGYGKITSIKITDPGKGYLTKPIIEIVGSQTEDGTPAKVSAILGKSAIRTAHIRVKFDRLSKQIEIEELKEVEVFTGSNVNSIFNLEWPMNLQTDKVKITVDGRELLRSEYRYENVENTDKTYTRQKGRVIFTTAPAQGASIRIEYYKPIDMLAATDRIHHFYNPTTGMPGKDFAQLMKGIDYGGVEVKSYGFAGASGWDTQGWYTDTWDTFDNTYEDEVFVADGSTIFVELSKPLEAGIVYNIYRRDSSNTFPNPNSFVRLDDPNYGTPQQINEDAITNSILGDGTTTVIDLDTLGVEFGDGDTIIIRKTTSDGSIVPDPTSYDTQLSGGDLPYQTAKGVNAEDIIVDGDGFVNPITHAGPEELVPGLITDALDIKVFTRDNDGNGVIYSQSYTTDGNRTVFNLGTIPSTNDAILVKVNDIIVSDTEYTVDWNNEILTFNSAPAADQELNIISQSIGTDSLLDYGKLITDGSTTEIITTVDWVDGASVSASVDGNPLNVIVFNSEEEGYELPNAKIGIRFDEVLLEGRVIHYAVFSDDAEIKYSRVVATNFTGDGSNTEFEILDLPYYAVPLEHKILVKVGNRILNPGYNIKFTIPENNFRTYRFEGFQQPPGSLDVEELKVFLNGVEIQPPTDWRYDVANNTILLTDDTGNPGDIVEIFAINDGEYAFGYLNGDGAWIDTPSTLHLKTAPALGEEIEILQFSNHDILGIERINYDVVNRSSIVVDSEQTTYRLLKSGIIQLRDLATDAQYVWVSKNGELLTPSVDYYVMDDLSRVRLTTIPSNGDVIDVLHFSAPVGTTKFAYRQFKDMLNRTHFKRLDKAEVTLRQPLNYYDQRIEVKNGAALAEPNKGRNIPGIIWINGERIEYFVKEDNTLRQLRRGTLGTGVKNVHEAGSKIYDQNVSKTVPYQDITMSKAFVADGVTNTFNPGFTIESVNSIEVFVSGTRLRKSEIQVFDPTIAQDSTEGDTTVPAEFTFVNGEIVLAQIPAEGSHVMIVKKTGSLWTDPGETLALAENSIARFLRAGTSELPE